MNEIRPSRPNNLDACWIPYTDNKYFNGTPRILARAAEILVITPCRSRLRSPRFVDSRRPLD
jgi:beta-alanine--pyruvate transaminase